MISGKSAFMFRVLLRTCCRHLLATILKEKEDTIRKILKNLEKALYIYMKILKHININSNIPEIKQSFHTFVVRTRSLAEY